MSTIMQGKTLPPVEVSSKGEAVLKDNKIVYQPWKSSVLTGKVRTVQHLAGRSAAKEINAALIEALKRAGFPQENYQTTSIINLKDAIFGTSGIVGMMVESGKKEFPWTSVVLDTTGDVRKAWGLDAESSAISILNQQGEVLFFKDGKLSPQEIEKVLGLIEGALATENATA